MNEVESARKNLSQAVIQLLSQDRLAGELMISISREIIVENSEIPLDLAWRDDQLVLRGNAQSINNLRMDELVNNLQHQALHLIWRHPLRYADASDHQLVSMACDIAVNQYLDHAPAGTMTLEQAQQTIREPLLAQQDSSYYLKKLRQLSIQQKRSLLKNANRTKSNPSDNDQLHEGWFHHGNSLLRQGRLQQIIQKSTAQLSEQQRGLLPQSVQEALRPTGKQYRLPLQHALWQLLGQIPRGYQPSRARFNRRQPQRLELPGRITKLVHPLDVFIDQSGSMSNQTVAQVIQMLNRLATKADIEMMVGTFDAAIQSPLQTVNQSHPLALERHGGGGTSYQVVFDYLIAHHVNRQTPVIIVTDGWGESSIDDHGYHRILWLLTREGDLSVKNMTTLTTRLEEQS